jgi:ABC-type branched-subunit amino acid transport system substrate-binding protein
MPLRRSVTVLAVLAVLALTTACGSRLSDEEKAAAIAAQGQGSGGFTDGGAVGDDGGVADPSATVGGDTTGGATGGTMTGGTTTGGSTGGTGGPGAACSPGDATSTGVTKSEIKVGNVSQITGLVPGFGQTGVNGVRAYFAKVNSEGGVCGRKLTLVTADDRFQTATNRAETEKLADQVIAFVGNTSVVDDGGAPVIDSKAVADVSLATTPPRVAAKNNFSPNPIDPTPGAGNGVQRILKYFDDTQGVASAAIFYQDAAVSASQVPAAEIAFQKAGIPVVEKYNVAPTATNFRSQATDMKNKKVDLVYTIAEINAISNLARAFADVGYKPKVPFYGAQTYGQKIIQLAGPAAEGIEIGLIFSVPEEKGSVKGMADFDTWYKRTASGTDADFFAVLAWVAADMFVEALRKAGPDPNQDKIIAQLKTFTAYTGGGIVAPINPAQKKQTVCYHILEIKGGKWLKQHPAKGFACAAS